MYLPANLLLLPLSFLIATHPAAVFAASRNAAQAPILPPIILPGDQQTLHPSPEPEVLEFVCCIL